MSQDLVDTNRAYVLHETLKGISGEVTNKFYETGEALKEVRDNKYWQTMGYDSFESYFSDPELSFSKSTVYHSIALVENFPDWRTMDRLPISKLIMLVPHLTNDNKPKLLEWAKGLSRGDLQEQLNTLGTVISEEFKPLPKIYKCRICRKIKGVFPQDLCQCGLSPEKNI